MDDQTTPTPAAEQVAAPTAPSSDAASAPARQGFTLRGRRWAYGAALAAAGVLAGSGVTYAVVSTAAPTSAVASQADQTGRTGPGGGGAPGGRGPLGTPPDGTAPQGQAPDAQPSTGAPAGTADGTTEPT